MLKHILLVEDDPMPAETLLRKLPRRFPGVIVDHLESEFELYTRVGKIQSGGSPIPDMVIADLMMPWVLARPDPPEAPPAVRAGGYSAAGLRCLEHFRLHLGASVPWILFTCRDTSVVRAELKELGVIQPVPVLNKEQSFDELFDEIERLSKTAQ